MCTGKLKSAKVKLQTGSQTLEPNKERSERYDPGKGRLVRRFLRFLLRSIAFALLVKIERVEGLENIPAQGPAILVMNHIAFVDPIVLVYVVPRDIVPMAKIEVYDYPAIGIFPRLWGVVPVRREEVDRRAVKEALQVLGAGEILLVAPEGTRGPALQRGKEGVAYLASRSGAPVVPVAITGTTGYPAFRLSSRWKGSGAHVRFGESFRYKPEYSRAKQAELRLMTDEAMYVVAKMLPPELRGFYADLSRASQETIE